MKYLKIANKGHLDIRLIALMGGTTKANDDFKIGHFGTGLKYTLAYLFRNQIDFKIFVGEEEVKIHIETENINQEDFHIICIGGHRTSITTRMGMDWEAWMIIRELYSNALDEGEASYSITERCEGKQNTTSFYIETTPEILEVFNSWNEYFIVGKEPFYETDTIKIFPQTGDLKIYKQGILVHRLDKQPSLFAYDIKNARINELREYRGLVSSDIAEILVSIKDKKVIQYFIENVKDEHYESTIDYDCSWLISFNDSWKEALNGVQIIHQKAKEAIEARGIKIDTAANITVPEKLYKGLTKVFEGIGALRVSKEVNDFFEIYNEQLDDKVNKAKKTLEDTGYYIEPELSFVYGIFGDKTVFAKVDFDTKKIYMSEKHLDKDLFSICCTLVEENEHYKTGFADETREFQQHFIDLFTNKLIEKEKIDLFN